MADSAMLQDEFNLGEYLQKLVFKKQEPPPEPDCYWFCKVNNKLQHLSPFSNNLLALACMALFYKLCFELACWIRIQWDHQLMQGRSRRRKINLNIVSRSMIQISLTGVVLFWPYFDVGTAVIPLSGKASLPPPTAVDDDSWSWKLAALLPAVCMARLLYKGLLVRNPTDIEVQTQSLGSSPLDLLLGPLFLAAVLLWLTLYKFMTEEAAIVAAACLGDAVAPLIGSVVGVFLGTIVASYLYLWAMGMPLLPLRIILAYAGIAAVVEGTSPANCDNFVTAVVLHFSMDRVKLLLGEF